MAGKRVATSKISKDDPEGMHASSEGEHEQEDGGAMAQTMSNERKISRPAKRHVSGFGGAPTNPFAKGGRSNPFSLLPEEEEKTEDKRNRESLAAATVGGEHDRVTQIRGLNRSFSRALEQKLDREPAADLSSLFRQYEGHWKSIIPRYSQDTEKKPMTGSAPAQDKTILLPSEPPKKATPHHEADKSGFPSTLGAGSEKLVTSEKTGPKTSAPVHLPFAFGAETEKSVGGVFVFGSEGGKTTASDASGVELSKPAMSALNEGPKTVVPEKPAPFAFGTETSSDRPTPFSFGGGSTSSTDKPPTSFAFGPSSGGSTFSFGQPSTAASSSSTATVAKPPPFSFSAFGADTANGPMTTLQKSAPTSSTGSSTTSPSFSFGGLTSSASMAPATTPFSFSFSTPLPSFNTQTSVAASITTTNEEGEEGIPEGEEASFSGERTNTELVRRGPGEEDEETLAEERIKLFVLEREDGGGWKDLGIALAKINRPRDTEKKRLLARSEGTGKVLLNTWIGGATTKVDHIEGKKDFTLICMGAEGKPVQYLIRCKEATQAASFAAAIGQP